MPFPTILAGAAEKAVASLKSMGTAVAVIPISGARRPVGPWVCEPAQVGAVTPLLRLAECASSLFNFQRSVRAG